MRQYKVFNYESEETIEADHFEFHRHQTVVFDEQAIDAAFELERIVVVEMPRQSGKTAWVKWLMDNRPDGPRYKKMQVIVPAQNLKFSCYGIHEQRVRIGLRGSGCAPLLVCDEWLEMDKSELEMLMQRNPEMKVLVLGTDVSELGGVWIVWDPVNGELRDRIRSMLCKEPPAELLAPGRRKDFERWVGQEVLK